MPRRQYFSSCLFLRRTSRWFDARVSFSPTVSQPGCRSTRLRFSSARQNERLRATAEADPDITCWFLPSPLVPPRRLPHRGWSIKRLQPLSSSPPHKQPPTPCTTRTESSQTTGKQVNKQNDGVNVFLIEVGDGMGGLD